MPSVEMRRSTRVFVPKAKSKPKNDGFVKVLRSGRRLWGDSVKNDWFTFDDDHTDSESQAFTPKQRHEANIITKIDDNGQKIDKMDVDGEKPVVLDEARVKSEGRVIRNVYSRKRKRNCAIFDEKREKRRFGLCFMRRKCVEKECEELCVVVVEGCDGCGVVSRFLGCVLWNLRSGGVDLARLSGFLVSVPFRNVFESFGIRFLLNHQLMENRGVCRISGVRQSIPFFTVDFSAIPLCFTNVHATLSLRSLRLSYLCWMNFRKENTSTDDDDDESLVVVCIDSQRDQMASIPASPGMKNGVAGLEAGNVGSQLVQYKSGVLTRSRSKRRRRSLRNRRARNPSHFVMLKTNGPPISSNVLFKKNGVQLPKFCAQELRRSARNSPTSKISVSKSSPKPLLKVPKSSPTSVLKVPKLSPTSVLKVPKLSPTSVLKGPRSSSRSVVNVPKPISSSASNVPNPISSSADLNVDVDSNQCCIVNVLVVETAKCYRIEGAEVAVAVSRSNEWVLAVKKDGMTQYCLKAQNELRPSTLNRFTQAVVCAVEDGWKLEFPDKKDWVVFKELYKVCGERNENIPASPVVKNIPIPGVSEVTDCWGSTNAFERPESYIRMESDELSRILTRKTANYDMDLEAEVWLREFNSGLDAAKYLSEDTFELMIDAFEKASYCSPKGVNDVKVAVSHCLDLASAEVSMLVCRYWTKRREQKRVPLLKVFELNEPRRAQQMTKPVLRKRRSLKRATAGQPLQCGRGKDDSVLQAIAVEQTMLEEQHALLRVEEARASLDKLVEVAIQKRQRAQFLMENADLATYQATMALRIADAVTQGAESQQAATHFLD